MTDFKKIAMTALGVTGVSYGLGWLYNKFFAEGIATLTFSAINVDVASQIKAGIDTSLGGKLLAYLKGVIPAGGTMSALLTLFVAAFIIVWLGGLVRDKINYGKTDNAKFGFGMAIAAGLVGLVTGALSPSIGYLGAALALLIYYSVIALVYTGLRSTEFGKFLPAP